MPKSMQELVPYLYDLTWPVERLNEALEALIDKRGYVRHLTDLPAPPSFVAHGSFELLQQWADAISQPYLVEVDAVSSTYSQVHEMIMGAAPALLYLPIGKDEHDRRFLAILRGGSRSMTVLDTNLRRTRVTVEDVSNLLRLNLEIPFAPVAELVLEAAKIPQERHNKAKRTMIGEQLSGVTIQGCLMVRLSPGAGLWRQIRHSNVLRPLGWVLFMYLILQVLGGIAWFFIGSGALQGHFETAFLLAWALILLTMIPFELISTWQQSLLSLNVSSVFKRRLLFGTLRLNPDDIRQHGSGQFLSRSMEAEAIEGLVMSGGFASLLSVIQVGSAVVVLSIGAGGVLHSLLLVLWLIFALLLTYRFVSQSINWVDTYRHMTNDLVERMLAHRTRLAQESRKTWHTEEDQLLSQYFNLSVNLDQINIQLSALIGRGWLIIGLLAIASTFVFNPGATELIAVSIGGIFLASQALGTLVGSIVSFAGVFIAWDQVSPIFKAATQPPGSGSPDAMFRVQSQRNSGNGSANGQAGKNGAANREQPALTVRNMRFQYHEFGRPVLDDVNITIHHGDRLLLEGPSGGGKSTLVSVLAGLKEARSGLVLLDGLDMPTMGRDEWRRRVVSAPQFHENHVFTETFAFNLLMGRRWPATPEDLQEAEQICRELGLGDLIDRMPSGLQQIVGESGWQLSHGERSRLYIARALLQNNRIIFLDESFAALDPENRYQALQTVLRRAPTLLVIAHP